MKYLIILKENKKGIALLFSIMLVTIFLTIVVGVLNISTKELNFSSSSKDSNNAFYAADSGIECALYNDKTDSTFFIDPNGQEIIKNDFYCFGHIVVLNGEFPNFNFVVNNLDDNKNSCAKVFISKTYDESTDPATLLTKIVSKGYNIGGDNNCDQAGLKSTERVIEVNY